MMILVNINTGHSQAYDSKLYNRNKKALNAKGFYSEKDAKKELDKNIEVVVIQDSSGYTTTCDVELFNREVEFRGKSMKHSEKLALLGYVVVEPKEVEIEPVIEEKNEDNGTSTATDGGDEVKS